MDSTRQESEKTEREKMRFEQYTRGAIKLPHPLAYCGRYKKKDFIKLFGTFDTECSNVRIDGAGVDDIDGINFDIKAGILYLWAFSFGGYGYYGRNGDMLSDFFSELSDKVDGKKFVIYVHNLSYDFQFLTSYLVFDDVIATSPHDVIAATYKNIIFRCSYKLTNKSLDVFLKEMGTPTQKLVYNYNTERLPHTKLTSEELQYCFNDVEGLHEAIEKKLIADGENVATVPPTSTGYVRKLIKGRQDRRVKGNIWDINQITPELYAMMKQAFIGGNTYANRQYIGEKLKKVYCYDITSSYPFTQLADLYPVTEFIKLSAEQCRMIENGELRVDGREFAYILRLRFHNVRQHAFDNCPSLPLYKCTKVGALIGRQTDPQGRLHIVSEYESYSGRLLWANDFEIILTDVDYEIMRDHYYFESVEVLEGYRALYGELPRCIKQTIRELFDKKSDLKKSDAYEYRKSKELLNSIYGMAAQDPGKQKYVLKNNELVEDNKTLEELLYDATSRIGKAAEPYAWGIWVTAWGHYHLNELILKAGTSFVYCDTDSVYTTAPMDLEMINAVNRGRLLQMRQPLRRDGQYPGKWKLEKVCDEFKVLGPKRYAYKIKGDYNYIVAGIEDASNKFDGDLDDFVDGLVIEDAKTDIIYFYEDDRNPIKYKGYYVQNSVYMEKVPYTLSAVGSDFHGKIL